MTRVDIAKKYGDRILDTPEGINDLIEEIETVVRKLKERYNYILGRGADNPDLIVCKEELDSSDYGLDYDGGYFLCSSLRPNDLHITWRDTQHEVNDDNVA